MARFFINPKGENMNQQTEITYPNITGGAKQFYFNFCAWSAQDVRVIKNGALLDSGEYDVLLNDLPENPNFGHQGGSIVLHAAPKDGDSIVISRRIHLERVVAYQPTKSVLPSDLNMDLNYMMAVLCDFGRRLDKLDNSATA
jgi:hypothetical protein